MYSGSTAVTVNGIDANERTTPPAAALKLRRARGQRARGYVRAWWFRAGGTCTIDIELAVHVAVLMSRLIADANLGTVKTRKTRRGFQATRLRILGTVLECRHNRELQYDLQN